MKQKDAGPRGAQDKDGSIELTLLKALLLNVLDCSSRYWRHQFLVSTLFGDSVAELFIRHTEHISDQAQEILNRIQTLGENEDELRLQIPAWETLVSRHQALRQIRHDLQHERVMLGRWRRQLMAGAVCDLETLSLLQDILAQNEDWNADVSKLMEHLQQEPANSETPRLNTLDHQIQLRPTSRI